MHKIAIALAVPLTLALALGGPLVASADPPGDPGGGAGYGVLTSSLDSGGAGTALGGAAYGGDTIAGGWGGSLGGVKGFWSTGNGTGSACQAPTFVRLGEPYYAAPYGLYMDAKFGYYNNIDRVGGEVGCAFAINDPGSIGNPFQVTCQASEWATTTWTMASGAYGASDSATFDGTAAPSRYQWVTLASRTSSDFAVDCPYIRSIRSSICVYRLLETSTYCESFVWSSVASYNNTSYENPDPLVNGCANPDIAAMLPEDCAPYNGGPDYADYCQDPPELVVGDWLDFSTWVPNVIAHWQAWTGYEAWCLFVPLDGFDRGGWVADAWAGSAAAGIVSTIGAVGDGWAVAGDCGLLFESGSDDPVPNFGINTCDYSSTAAPVKTLLSWAMSIGFAWWAVQFLIACILGVVNRKIPSPITDDKSALGVHFE